MKDKKILIGISGGIAAYKIPLLIRLYKKAGAEVKVVISKNGLEFVTRVTLETLSNNKIYCETFAEINDYSTEHISLTDWADIFVLAPATANIIGKYANGIADDALSTSLLAFDKDVIIAPAMNCKMYDNFAVQKNMKYLQDNGVHFLDAEIGMLACGYSGKGRMAEPEDIFDFTKHVFNRKSDSILKGKNILVTAGGTREPIDPVRYLANRSSGKTGYEIANYFRDLGCNVTLISGITNLKKPYGVKTLMVESSNEMHKAVLSELNSSNILIMAAAVADYTFEYSESKIKKNGKDPFFNPIPSVDILKDISKIKKDNQIFVGFALETDNVYDNAVKKLKNKNLDFIVMNSITENFSPFGSENNSVRIIGKNGYDQNYEDINKDQIGQFIEDAILGLK
ncbi:MAG: bifunctional phosphopantothenoylcysteine decarboxylase/phosphopantothenate--cysteine ligase CoaBC [Candidatus Delongbacteria bacterium]|nr:bifunctional phosphopantothenoylcysteine decarboxylase/phosphopantothenate--cysteine ligase CoaBC [Candidatus Delongbacteria bacterium]MBN2836337.1 bifunctional phosphopantothenoylcysteine decarboxylase/phosphopantothenate--cysteine ligase CoaBC [Candidatus Delongbacteria bacterium]